MSLSAAAFAAAADTLLLGAVALAAMPPQYALRAAVTGIAIGVAVLMTAQAMFGGPPPVPFGGVAAGTLVLGLCVVHAAALGRAAVIRRGGQPARPDGAGATGHAALLAAAIVLTGWDTLGAGWLASFTALALALSVAVLLALAIRRIEALGFLALALTLYLALQAIWPGLRAMFGS